MSPGCRKPNLTTSEATCGSMPPPARHGPRCSRDPRRFHRSMTRPFFNRDRISDFEIFGRHTTHALAKLHSRLADGTPVDFQDLVARFTLDSATEFLFGANVHSLDAELPFPHDDVRAAAA